MVGSSTIPEPTLLVLIVGALLVASGLFLVVALVGFLGGFRELEPTGEDDELVVSARRSVEPVEPD